MTGMNLSLSREEKKSSSKVTLDGSFIITSILFFLAVSGWGGQRWYIKTLDDKLASLNATLEQNSAQLHGDRVNRVAYFDDRLRLIEQQLSSNQVDAKKLLTQVESLTVPQVRLTRYEYNKAENFVVVAGETENFKYVAAQIISLKSEDLFTEIRVDSLKRTKEGRVEFSLKAQF